MDTDDVYPALPVPRGCGTRKKDGIYIEVGLAPPGFGKPLEEFILCPPIDLAGIHVPNRGVTMIEVNGVWHIVDRVGEGNYPNALDFLEEVRRFGLSRAMPPDIDFSRITPESRIIVVHPRGRILNWQDYDIQPDCPRGRPHGDMCAGFWRHDIEGGAALEQDRVRRTMPSFWYEGHARPAAVEPQYAPAAIASFPVSRLVVVNGDRAAERLSKISRAGVPTAIVEE